jgi:ferritin-like metal-binding protein YciE
MAESSGAVIRRYLEAAAAAESNSVSQLKTFESEGDNVAVKAMFNAHRLETELQHQHLIARLKALDGEASIGRDLLAHIFRLPAMAAQIGHRKDDLTTQNLVAAYGFESNEIAMYESLITMAEAAGDTDTAELARSIQAEEKAAAEKIWKLLPDAALDSARAATGS